MRYPPSVQVLKSFKNFSEVQCHFFLCQVAPAHYIIQESPLVRPEKNREFIFFLMSGPHITFYLKKPKNTGLHFQYKYVAVGHLVGVQQLNQVGMVQSLQESDLLQHLFSAQQLFVNVFGRDCALAPSLVAPFSHREAAPEERR